MFSIVSIGCTHHKQQKHEQLPLIKAYKKVIEEVTARKAAVLTHTGDTSVYSYLSPDAQDTETRCLTMPVAEKGLWQLRIDGNHDKTGASLNESTVNSRYQYYVDNDKWKKLMYMGDYELRVIDVDGQKLQVLPLPYPPRHAFAATGDVKDNREILGAASRFVQDMLKKGVEKSDPGIPLLILYHGTVGAGNLKLGDENVFMCGEDVVVPLSMFPQRDNCAVITSHIHRPQVLRERAPFVCVTGSLIHHTIDQASHDCGFYHTQFNGTMWEWEFVPVDVVRLKKITVDLAKYQDVPPEVAAEMLVKEIPHNENNVFGITIVKPAVSTAVVSEKKIYDALVKQGVVVQSIKIEEEGQPTITETDQRVAHDMGLGVRDHVGAYIDSKPEIAAILQEAGVTKEDVLAAADEVECTMVEDVA